SNASPSSPAANGTKLKSSLPGLTRQSRSRKAASAKDSSSRHRSPRPTARAFSCPSKNHPQKDDGNEELKYKSVIPALVAGTQSTLTLVAKIAGAPAPTPRLLISAEGTNGSRAQGPG